MTEEWRHVARALGACYSNAETELPPDMRDPLPGEAGFDQWADETFGTEAAALIVAFDAITEYRATAADSAEYRVPAEVKRAVEAEMNNLAEAITQQLNERRSGNA